MNYRDAQSAGEYDFDLIYPDGRTAPLEVTQALDQEVEDAAAAVRDPRKGGPSVPRVECTNRWWIVPMVGARINRIRKESDAVLARIEAEGRDRFFGYTDAAESDAVRAAFTDLNIEFGVVIGVGGEVHSLSSPDSDGGSVSSGSVQTAVETEAWKPDNRSKLTGGDREGAHLFVEVGYTNFLPWIALVDEAPPDSAPRLPEGIEVAWAVALDRDGARYVVWRADSGIGWQHLGRVALEHSEQGLG
jgi:hypothetical protein